MPADYDSILAAITEAFRRRQGRLLAKKTGVHVDTVLRWRARVDIPDPIYVDPLIASLYALKLYRVKGKR